MKGYQSNRQLSEMILPLGSQPKEVRVYLREKGIMAQRILVIDDTQELLDFLRAILEKQGYEVYIAKNVFEDLHEVEHLHPDLIILDFMMGKQKEGWHMLQRLKSYPPTASLPIVVSSVAMTITSEQTHYLQRQGIPSLGKPFEIDYLLETVDRILQPRPS